MKDEADIPIFIDGEEVVERPMFKGADDFAAYVTKIAEGRSFCVTVKHPHDEDSGVAAVYIGDEEPPEKCPECSDDIEEPPKE